MSVPIPKIACQTCLAKQGIQQPLVEVENGRFTDQQGRLCAKLWCVRCGAQPGGIPLVQEQPACEKCGFAKRGWVRGTQETNAPENAQAFLNVMRTQAVPEGKAFLDLMRPNSA